MMAPRTVGILYFDAGSGHRSAADGLALAISRARPSWRVQTVNIVDLLAHNRLQQAIMRLGIWMFNREMKREQIPDYEKVIRGSCLLRDRLDQTAMQRFWTGFGPDIIISVTPLYHPPIFESARRANPRVVCVTVPVDFAEPFPDCWFTPSVDQVYLLPTAELERQARAAGIPAGARQRIGGMPIDPRFYTPPELDRAAELTRLGLDPARPTALVHFGGQGHVAVEAIARAMAAVQVPINTIFLCGRDRTMLRRLAQLPTPYPKAALPFEPEPPVRYLALADVAIGKPGSMTITEALVTGTPLIALQSRALATVQRANEAWLMESGAGLVVPTAAELPAAIRTVLSENTFALSARRLAHRGVFDAAEAIIGLAEVSHAAGHPAE